MPSTRPAVPYPGADPGVDQWEWSPLKLNIYHFNVVFKPKRLRFVICCNYFTGCISHLSLVIIFNKICFYSFRSSHWQIYDLFYISTKPVKLCQWQCSIFIKVTGGRLETLLKLNFFTDIFKDLDHAVSLRLCRAAILKNIYFQKQFPGGV